MYPKIMPLKMKAHAVKSKPLYNYIQGKKTKKLWLLGDGKKKSLYCIRMGMTEAEGKCILYTVLTTFLKF